VALAEVTAAVVHCAEITKYFGAVCALDRITVRFDSHQVVGLVGDNGAGKSTFVRILSGIHQPDTGRLWVGDREFASLTPEIARSVGIETVYQDLMVCDNLTAAENISLGREPIRFRFGPIAWIDRRRTQAVADDRIARVGVRLPNLVEPIRRFSGGQRQAVAIARAMTDDCRLLLMDEPTAALGTKQTQATLSLIRHLRDNGLAVVMISHNLEHVMQVADRVVALRLGRVVLDKMMKDTTPEEIVANMTGAA
jgi:ABC-type sugar transport system ATPase subunit